MVERIPQSVAKRCVFKAYVATTQAPATGKTIVIVISKNGGAFANPNAGATNATEIANGWYYFDAATADTGTKGPFIVRGTEATIDEAEVVYEIVDPNNAGFAALPAVAAEASGGLPTLSAAQASNGTIQANVHRWLTGTPNALQSGRIDSYIGAIASGIIAAASFAANALDAVWSTTTRLLTAGTNIVLAKDVGVTGFNDLSAAQVNVEADTALADVGVTGTITGRIDAAISTRLASASYTAPDNADIVAIKAKTDALTFTVPNQVDANALSGGGTGLTAQQTRDAMKLAPTAGSPAADSIDDELDTIKAKTNALPSDPADASDIAASFSTVNTKLDTIDDFVDTEVAAIKAKTDLIPATPAATGDAMTLTAAYDAAKTAAQAGDAMALTSGERTTLTAAIWAAGSRTLTSFGTLVADVATAVWGATTRLLSAGTNIVLAKGVGVTGFNDLSAAQVNTEADTALADAGVTTTVTGRIDVAVSTRLATAGYTAPDNSSITAIKAKTDGLPADPADASDVAASFASITSTLATIASYIDTEVAAIKAKTDNLPGSPAAVGSAMTLTSGERTAVAAALMALTDALESGQTFAESMRLALASAAGQLSGAPDGPIELKSPDGTKTRGTYDIDGTGNRTGFTEGDLS